VQLAVPETFVESFDIGIDTPLRGIVDPVWNAAGWSQSINFDDGNWKPHE